MKDVIELQGSVYKTTKLVLAKFGMDGQTLRKMVQANQVSPPVRIGNKNYYKWESIEPQILATCRG
jgi:hypothetical protein